MKIQASYKQILFCQIIFKLFLIAVLKNLTPSGVLHFDDAECSLNELVMLESSENLFGN